MEKLFCIEKFPESLRPDIAGMYNEIVFLREEVNGLRRQLFGNKSERYVTGELILPKDSIFNEAESLVQEDEKKIESEKPKTTEVKPHTREVGKRKPLPADLPREVIMHDLPDEQKFCPADGAALVKIGEDVVEKLAIEPAKAIVKCHITPRYGCPCCKTGVYQEKAEASVLPKSIFEPCLLAYLTTQKYVYSMPLYRMEKMFAQLGVEISRTTFARWMIAAGEFLNPLVLAMQDFILKHNVVHMDETPVQVLKGTQKSATSDSYMWIMSTPEHTTPAVAYFFDTSRAGSVPSHLLADFQGYLQVDGYSGYNEICKRNNIARVGCWAHCRRKFEDSKVSGAKESSPIAEEFLKDIQELFKLEKAWKDFTPELRLQQRKIQSQPILDSIKTRLEKKISSVPPRSKLGSALGYAQNEWENLVRFLENGETSLSNNRAENFIRPFALGRKNWLFSSTVEGAQASANLYSLAITAGENGWNVFEYFKKLYTELPKLRETNPDADLAAYLPWSLKKD